MANNFYYIFVFLGTVIFCIGLVLFFGKLFYNLATSAVKQVDIIMDSSIDEKEKDRRILRNLVGLIKYLFLTVILLTLLVTCSILPAFLYANIYMDNQGDISSIYFYLSMFLGSFSLLLFRKSSDYSYWSRLLHVIILDNYNIGKYLFRREIGKLQIDKYLQEQSFIIVTGLARAGTTALTKLLYSQDVFHSIRYANVPFLLAPNIWKKIYDPKKSIKKERAHGDQVLFSENSIEALEEYFFKVYLNDRYIKENHLEKHEISEELMLKYQMYQELFRQKKDTIYLAKNNNFLLRYESVLKCCKNFKVVLIFRNPLDHAKSLLSQHEMFVQKQTEDGFVLQYMDWLGHYEFGLNQKEFLFESNLDLARYDKRSLSYWLAIWFNYYNYVNTLLDHDKIILVHYKDLLQSPEELIQALEYNLDIKFKKQSIRKFSPRSQNKEITYELDSDLLDRCEGIYEDLVSRKIYLTD